MHDVKMEGKKEEKTIDCECKLKRNSFPLFSLIDV